MTFSKAVRVFALAANVAVGVLGCGVAYAQQASPPVATSSGVSSGAAVGAAAPPRCDVNCVRSNAGRASEACAPQIELKSPSDFDWIARPTPGIFQQADPSSPADAIVRYRGDSVRFMSPEKGWVRVSYECSYDVEAQRVVAVIVRAGRLDQPTSTAQPIDASAAAAIPANATQAAAHPAAAPSAAAPQAAAKPKPKVWEPSRVEIQQQPANPKRNM
ncbi:hypothetical protein [Bradyrhizobium sp. dw_411]|uniref:hypothetical protein n=1 Tax=Bradyrhizobium sp. dw_411 TaxID=2720082 RepID=UPI001BCE25E2|nr:hypothetical protein [Bradyrhizobium sp. dw_411]